jgi:2-polyprenyl-3-methyl-5-hydroxy-6-metoxy-1,4-benzoquinol methylase
MNKETLDKLEKICQAADWHLTQIQNVIPILAELKKLLEGAKHNEHLECKKQLEELKEEIKFLLANPNPDQRIFEYLKQKLMLEDWPAAVPKDDISITDKEKEIRANNILDAIIGENLEGKKFLDFGCGEGHVAKQAIKQNCALSVGYDITRNYEWHQGNKLIYTDNIKQVKDNGPYKVILMYDVLDHCQDPVEVLKNVKDLLSDEADNIALSGRVYLRCHPWCCRHGNHHYTQLNKAFIHLIFTTKELEQLDLKNEKTIEITDPEKEYDKIIRDSGLEILDKSIKTKEIEPFFKENVAIQQRIKTNFELKNKVYIPYKTSIEFVDYILVKRNVEV